MMYRVVIEAYKSATYIIDADYEDSAIEHAMELFNLDDIDYSISVTELEVKE